MNMFDSALDKNPGLRQCQSAQDLAMAVDEAKNHGARLYSWKDYEQALTFYNVIPPHNHHTHTHTPWPVIFAAAPLRSCRDRH
jgi:hypothetical protein